MKTPRSFFSLITVSLLLLSRRGRKFATVAQAEKETFAVGGDPIGLDEFHWFTVVRFRENFSFRCSGALIGARYVITAYHCVRNVRDNESFIVQVGYYCREPRNCLRDNFLAEVTEWHRHESGDFAILVLNKSVSTQPAVPYLGEDFHPPQSFTTNRGKRPRKLLMVAGGRGGTNAELTAFATKVEVTYLAPEECRDQLNNMSIGSLVNGTVICSTPENGNPCFGDSGAALVVPGRRQFLGREVIMAVHQIAPRECEIAGDRPILHFRVADASELIRRVVCDGDSPEDWCPAKLEADLLYALPGHMSGIGHGALSFNSHSTRLLSGGYDDTAKIWDLGGDELLASFEDGAWVEAVQFHPNQEFFASGSRQGHVKVWRADTPEQPLKVFEGHGFSVLSIAWDPSGTRLASSYSDLSIWLWSLTLLSAEAITIPTDHIGDINSIAFHPDGTQLASASDDGTIKLWTTNHPFYTIRTWTRHTEAVLTVSYSPDGRFLASGSDDNTAKVWSVASGRIKHDFRGHTGLVRDVAWSPDSQFLATGSADGTVRVWDAVNGGSPLAVLDHGEYGSQVYGVEWSPDGTLLATGVGGPSSGNEIILWAVRAQRPVEVTPSCNS